MVAIDPYDKKNPYQVVVENSKTLDCPSGDLTFESVEATVSGALGVQKAAVVPEISTIVPKGHKQASTMPAWVQSEDSEWNKIGNNGTFQPISEVPLGQKALPLNWVYTNKTNADNVICENKSRCVVVGSKQELDSQFQTFAPCAKLVTFRVLLNLMVFFKMYVCFFDVSTAFTYAAIAPGLDTYVTAPPGKMFKLGEGWTKFAKLLKELYGTKTAPKAWYDLLKSTIMAFDPLIKCSLIEPCFFYKVTPSFQFFALIHVDDSALVSTSKTYNQSFLQHIGSNFKIKTEAYAKQFLGMKLRWSSNGVHLSQTAKN